MKDLKLSQFDRRSIPGYTGDYIKSVYLDDGILTVLTNDDTVIPLGKLLPAAARNVTDAAINAEGVLVLTFDNGDVAELGYMANILRGEIPELPGDGLFSGPNLAFKPLNVDQGTIEESEGTALITANRIDQSVIAPGTVSTYDSIVHKLTINGISATHQEPSIAGPQTLEWDDVVDGLITVPAGTYQLQVESVAGAPGTAYLEVQDASDDTVLATSNIAVRNNHGNRYTSLCIRGLLELSVETQIRVVQYSGEAGNAGLGNFTLLPEVEGAAIRSIRLDRVSADALTGVGAIPSAGESGTSAVFTAYQDYLDAQPNLEYVVNTDWMTETHGVTVKDVTVIGDYVYTIPDNKTFVYVYHSPTDKTTYVPVSTPVHAWRRVGTTLMVITLEQVVTIDLGVASTVNVTLPLLTSSVLHATDDLVFTYDDTEVRIVSLADGSYVSSLDVTDTVPDNQLGYLTLPLGDVYARAGYWLVQYNWGALLMTPTTLVPTTVFLPEHASKVDINTDTLTAVATVGNEYNVLTPNDFGGLSTKYGFAISANMARGSSYQAWFSMRQEDRQTHGWLTPSNTPTKTNPVILTATADHTFTCNGVYLRSGTGHNTHYNEIKIEGFDGTDWVEVGSWQGFNDYELTLMFPAGDFTGTALRAVFYGFSSSRNNYISVANFKLLHTNQPMERNVIPDLTVATTDITITGTEGVAGSELVNLSRHGYEITDEWSATIDGSPGIIEVDLARTTLVKGYALVQSNVGSTPPAAWTIEGFDGTDWTTIERVTDYVGPGTGLRDKRLFEEMSLNKIRMVIDIAYSHNLENPTVATDNGKAWKVLGDGTVLTCSPVYAYAGIDVINVIDKDEPIGVAFASGVGVGAFVQYEFPTPSIIDGVYFSNYHPALRFLRSAVEISNDGVEWTEVIEVTADAEYIFPTAVTTTFIRIRALEVTTAAGMGAGLGTFKPIITSVVQVPADVGLARLEVLSDHPPEGITGTQVTYDILAEDLLTSGEPGTAPDVASDNVTLLHRLPASPTVIEGRGNADITLEDGTIVRSSALYNASQHITDILDRITTTGVVFAKGTALSSYVRYEFPEPVEIAGIYFSNHNPSFRFLSAVVEISVDGSAWTEVTQVAEDGSYAFSPIIAKYVLIRPLTVSNTQGGLGNFSIYLANDGGLSTNGKSIPTTAMTTTTFESLVHVPVTMNDLITIADTSYLADGRYVTSGGLNYSVVTDDLNLVTNDGERFTLRGTDIAAPVTSYLGTGRTVTQNNIALRTVDWPSGVVNSYNDVIRDTEGLHWITPSDSILNDAAMRIYNEFTDEFTDIMPQGVLKSAKDSYAFTTPFGNGKAYVWSTAKTYDVVSIDSNIVPYQRTLSTLTLEGNDVYNVVRRSQTLEGSNVTVTADVASYNEEYGLKSVISSNDIRHWLSEVVKEATIIYEFDLPQSVDAIHLTTGYHIPFNADTITIAVSDDGINYTPVVTNYVIDNASTFLAQVIPLGSTMTCKYIRFTMQNPDSTRVGVGKLIPLSTEASNPNELINPMEVISLRTVQYDAKSAFNSQVIAVTCPNAAVGFEPDEVHLGTDISTQNTCVKTLSGDLALTYEYATPVVVTELVMSSVSGYTPLTVTLEGSNDGTAWTDLGTFNGTVVSSYTPCIDAPVVNSTAYTFYRTTVTSAEHTDQKFVHRLALITEDDIRTDRSLVKPVGSTVGAPVYRVQGADGSYYVWSNVGEFVTRIHPDGKLEHIATALGYVHFGGFYDHVNNKLCIRSKYYSTSKTEYMTVIDDTSVVVRRIKLSEIQPEFFNLLDGQVIAYSERGDGSKTLNTFDPSTFYNELRSVNNDSAATNLQLFHGYLAPDGYIYTPAYGSVPPMARYNPATNQWHGITELPGTTRYSKITATKSGDLLCWPMYTSSADIPRYARISFPGAAELPDAVVNSPINKSR